MMSPLIRVGTAGWSIPAGSKPGFPAEGHQLTRYSSHFRAVEINSSFYRPHMRATYERWASLVPGDFRFAVKLPRAITHTAKLVNAGSSLTSFLASANGLGAKLGCLLVQLPPALALDTHAAAVFFAELRNQYCGHVAVEARHASWFGTAADDVLAIAQCARVAADPVLHVGLPARYVAGGFAYTRLHGSPKVYYSTYAAAYLKRLSTQLIARAAASIESWCVFDNTAAGAAVRNASTLQRLCATAMTGRASVAHAAHESANAMHARPAPGTGPAAASQRGPAQ